MAGGNDQVVLLGSKGNTFVTRIRIALAEKHINYKYREEDLTNKSPLLLQMNPNHKKVPVLIHNGKPVCESLVILEYIDQEWPHESPLLPPEGYQRVQAKVLANFIDHTIYPIGMRIWADVKGEDQENEAKEELIEIFKTLEYKLGDKSYFGGDIFGFVDVALVPFYSRFHVYDAFGNFKIEPLFPRLMAWGKRCMLREGVTKSLANPNKIYEHFLQFQMNIMTE